MLELKIGDKKRCTLTFDNLRLSKTRKALVFYLRDLGLPLAAAKFVVKRALYAKFSGVRLYRLTALHYIYVNYDEGFFFVGTEQQVIDKVAERWCWRQGLLWVEMADHAATGRIMTREQVKDYVWEMERDRKLETKNVAPIERRRPKRRRRRRSKVRKVLSKIYGYDDL